MTPEEPCNHSTADGRPATASALTPACRGCSAGTRKSPPRPRPTTLARKRLRATAGRDRGGDPQACPDGCPSRRERSCLGLRRVPRSGRDRRRLWRRYRRAIQSLSLRNWVGPGFVTPLAPMRWRCLHRRPRHESARGREGRRQSLRLARPARPPAAWIASVPGTPDSLRPRRRSPLPTRSESSTDYIVLGEERAHWLALRVLSVNAHFLSDCSMHPCRVTGASRRTPSRCSIPHASAWRTRAGPARWNIPGA